MSHVPKTTKQTSVAVAAPEALPQSEEKMLAPAPVPAKPARSSARKKPLPEEAVVLEAESPVKASKNPKTKKPKLVRDSFTFPESDYVLIAELKQRALLAGQDIKKSELLRAGLLALAAMTDRNFLKATEGVERIKTGRPGK